MMHHTNMHHQVVPGHGHIQNHQGMPGPHQMPPPHQMHRETRLGMNPSQPGNGMAGGPMSGHNNMHTSHHNPAPHQHTPNMRPPMHMQLPPHQQGKPIRRTYNQNGGMPQQLSQPPPAYPVMAPRMPRPVSQHVQSYQSVQSSQEGNQPPNTLHNQSQSSSSLPPPAVPSTATMAAIGSAATEPHEAATVPDTVAVLPCDAALPTSKEKTPMCLVNELARYNKIKHQYRLTSECGPPHKKIFTVTLRLGESEEYTAEGSSIKRAQHAAAQKALLQTPHTRPPPKPHTLGLHLHASTPHANKCGSVMPTVELNALAMKRCEPAVYTALPPAVRPLAPGAPLPPPVRYPRHARPIMRFNSNYQNRFPNGYQANRDFHQRGGVGMNGMNTNLLYRVELGVGARRYTGEGESPQAARHHAAAQALQDIRRLEPHSKLTEAAAGEEGEPDTTQTDQAEEDTDEVKSPVSLVHELVLRRNLSVTFNVKSERGPPHMKMFTTVCTVGDVVTEAEGNGKKVSKKRAAANMLEELKKKWPPLAFKAMPQRHPRQLNAATTKKKTRNLIKEVAVKSSGSGVKSEVQHDDSNGSSNPISRLAQARHAARARSPVYRVVEERRVARRRDFVVECAVDGITAHGTGPNKKTAKKNAAENALLALGHTPTSPIKTEGEAADSGKPDARKTNNASVADVGAAAGALVQPGGPAGRQLAPGLLLMQDHNAASDGAAASSSIVASGEAESATSQPKAQLMYLAKLLGFKVEFSNFPKRNHGEYLSLVSLTTEPPVVCHGSADSVEASHQVCARAALHALASMGLHEPQAERPPVAPAGSAVLANGISK